MRIRMSETRQGSPDGRVVYEYTAGETYSGDTTPPVSDDLAAVFVREGWAVVAGTLVPAKARAKKVTGPAETKENETEDDGE
jgi:hypothetical protein